MEDKKNPTIKENDPLHSELKRRCEIIRLPIKSMIGWHEALAAVEAFVNNYDGSHFSEFDAGVLEGAVGIIRMKIRESSGLDIAALKAEVERLKAAERIRVAGLRETRDALVEKLRAENERLNKTIAHLDKLCCKFVNERENLRARCEAAEGKVEKVREYIEETIRKPSFPFYPHAVKALKQILK